jgi:dihydrosphingosine 1-phosphate phosphatase
MGREGNVVERWDCQDDLQCVLLIEVQTRPEYLIIYFQIHAGIFVIFAWRILAKSVLHMILPPTFRLLAQAFTLPHRRFYTPATDYKNVPSELGLHPIPSVIDLPEHLGMETEMDIGAKASGFGFGGNEAELRARGGKVNGNTAERGYGTVYGVGNGKSNWELEKHGNGTEVVKDDAEVKRYDADGAHFYFTVQIYVDADIRLRQS